MEPLVTSLLDPARLGLLRRASLRPRGAAEGVYAGRHASRYRGESAEFADYREYAAGDDLRRVDWKVYARSDKHYVKLFEAERSLCSLVLVDGSGSMAFDGALARGPSKFLHACRLAAALAYMTVRAGDETGLGVARDGVGAFLGPRPGWRQLAAVVRALTAETPAGGTDLAACLDGVYARLSRRGTLVVVSDFLDAGEAFWRAVGRFRAARFDLVLLHVMHPEEIELPAAAVARFVGTEGEAGRFDAEPDEIAAAYRERFARHVREVRAGAQTRGCAWHAARSDEDPYVFLKRCFLAAGGG